MPVPGALTEGRCTERAGRQLRVLAIDVGYTGAGELCWICFCDLILYAMLPAHDAGCNDQQSGSSGSATGLAWGHGAYSAPFDDVWAKISARWEGRGLYYGVNLLRLSRVPLVKGQRRSGSVLHPMVGMYAAGGWQRVQCSPTAALRQKVAKLGELRIGAKPGELRKIQAFIAAPQCCSPHSMI